MRGRGDYELTRPYWGQIAAGLKPIYGAPSPEAAWASGVTATEARDVLWTYNSTELYRLLVIDRGCSAKR